MTPSCPRSWLTWGAYVFSSQARPRPVLFEHHRSDPRLSDSRETAISVMTMLERAGGNGGAELLFRSYVLDAPWHSFDDREKAIIKKTTRLFAKELVRAGFIDP